jgi:hypothetical protein
MTNAQVIQQKLVASWSFDSISGHTFYDGTGHGFNASWVGTGISQAAGLKGQALASSGSSYEMTVSNSRDSFSLSRLTIEAWYNPDIAAGAFIFDYQYVASGVYNGYGLYISDDRRANFSASNSTRSGWYVVTSTTAVTAGKWYHIAGSYDGASFRVYVNGTLEATTPYSGGIGYPVAADARIACQTLMGGTVRLFNQGKIDELRLYNYALSGDSIKAHYEALRPAVPVLVPCTPNPTYDRKPFFRWLHNPNIAQYRLQIDTLLSFLNPIISVPLADTFFQPGVNLPVRIVYWRVRNDADTTTWSVISSLTILDPTTPQIIPYAPDPTINRRPVLTWHSASGSASYTIQIGTAFTGFSPPLISDVTADTFYQPLVNLPIGPVYWRVRSTAGSQFSIIDTFTVQNDSVPVLIPISPDTQSTRRPVFTWHPGTGATAYRIQVDSVGNFLSPFISLPLSDTFYVPQANLPAGRLVWRVSANFDYSKYSSVDTFWVMPTAADGRRLSEKVLRGITILSNSISRGMSVAFAMKSAGRVSFDLYSLSGKRIARLYEGTASSGSHVVTFKNTGNGALLPFGGYVLECTAEGIVSTKKVMIVR